MNEYFKIIKIVPGRVVVPGFGILDFSKTVSTDVCEILYKKGFPYLGLTSKGKEKYHPKPAKKQKKEE